MTGPVNKRSKTDATLKIAGTDYQKLLALEVCLNAPNDDAIVYLETFGDISIGDQSTEVKLHSGDRQTLANADIDFWKTLYNWVSDWNSVYKTYSQLCLSTTATIIEKSIFIDWSKLVPAERLLRIKSVNKNETIDKFHKFIFEQSDDFLQNILGRVEIRTGEIGIKALWERLLKNQAIWMVDEEHKDVFIRDLAGATIQELATMPRHSCWKLDKKILREQCRKLCRLIFDEKIAFPVIEKGEIHPSMPLSYRCAYELRAINLKNKEQVAINDYLMSEVAIVRMTGRSPTVATDLGRYENNLHYKLTNLKESQGIDLDKSHVGSPLAIQNAQRVFYACTQWPIQDLPRVTDIESYFQMGRIHSLVEANAFVWKYREEDFDAS